MAQKTVVTMIDDIDGHEGTDVRLVSFSIDGADYEIDLGESNRASLEAGLAPFLAAARPARARAGRKTRTSKDTAVSAEIRTWARENGVQLSSRGRIPAAVRADFEAQVRR